MNETQDHEVTRRRRDFILRHHPDRGGDPDVFLAGLRAFDQERGQADGALPRVVIIRRRPWLMRQATAAARRLRHGRPPPRVR